ncbi:amidase [Virgibacillus kekensis]|uniref:Amidase n=1 Tax=Virgibacillus kekensis TaxID=202261 RepID=A0ABV9DMN5_9BACI
MDLKTYLSMDATEMANEIRKGNTTPEELVNLSTQQLKKVNPSLNAVIHERTARVMGDLQKGRYNTHGTFAGVPLLLKNISQTLEGEPLTAGARLLKSSISKQDSNFVRKLRDAGFLFMGHTNTPEMGLKNITEPELYGPTRNPWNPVHSAGGSSGGSAAAVASGIVPVAGANDGGGSIRIPASFTGLFGLKPTRGRTPVGPGTGRQWQGASIDFVLSRTVRDSAAMLDELQTFQPEAAFNTPLFPGSYKETMKLPFNRKLRVAYTVKSPVDTLVSDAAVDAVIKTVKWLEKEGHIVEEREPDMDGVQLMRDYYLMNSGEISNVLSQIEQGLGRSVTPEDVEIETWLFHEAGKSVSAAEFSASLASWDQAAAKMTAFHETYDFYITPATANTAPEVGELNHSPAKQEELRRQMKDSNPKQQQQLIYDMFLPSLTYTPHTQLANLTGQPAMSVPVHLSEAGLPLGVQVMAPKGGEDKLLQLAYQLESSEIWVGSKENPILRYKKEEINK